MSMPCIFCLAGLNFRPKIIFPSDGSPSAMFFSSATGRASVVVAVGIANGSLLRCRGESRKIFAVLLTKMLEGGERVVPGIFLSRVVIGLDVVAPMVLVGNWGQETTVDFPGGYSPNR
jgi:hypothetical protein